MLTTIQSLIISTITAFYPPLCYDISMLDPSYRITPKITSALMLIEACRQAIHDLPIDATVLQHLRETAALVTTHFSTQIEGNRLTLPEVQAVIKGARMPGRERDEREVRMPLVRYSPTGNRSQAACGLLVACSVMACSVWLAWMGVGSTMIRAF